MTTLLDEPAARRSRSPAERLRATMAAMRLSFTWFGVRKALTAEQKSEAADAFGAEGSFLSAGKKLIDTKHPKFKAVTSVRNRAIQFWRSMSQPFPEPGVRLVRQDDLQDVCDRMGAFKDELDAAVADLDRHYEALQAAARERLGSLYNPADYPESLRGLFDMGWDFPSVEPAEYLRHLSPDLYEEESRRVSARFEEAVRLAEEAFLAELGRLVSHLSERLSGRDDGRPKIFRDSAVENLTEFFDRFRRLSVRSSDELDRLVERAQEIVRGIEPQALRDDQGLRQHVATELSQVQSVVDGLMVDRPRRNILRRPR
jgi:hypothetical protein